MGRMTGVFGSAKCARDGSVMISCAVMAGAPECGPAESAQLNGAGAFRFLILRA